MLEAVANRTFHFVEPEAQPCVTCGVLAPIIEKHSDTIGTYHYAAKYCSEACRLIARPPKPRSPRNVKPDRYTDGHGYVQVRVPLGHFEYTSQNRGRVSEHRAVMAEMLGRALAPGENVHHINGLRDDNRPENLELWERSQPAGQRKGQKRHCATCQCA